MPSQEPVFLTMLVVFMAVVITLVLLGGNDNKNP